MERILLKVEDESKSFRGPTAVGLVGPVSIRKPERRAKYDLFFTDKRIIAAVIFSTSDLSRISVDVVSGFEIAMKWKKLREERRKAFKNKTPEEILRMHPESFEIPYKCIKSVKIKKGLLGASMEIEVFYEGEVKKVKLPIPKAKAEEVKSFLKSRLGEKVK